MFSDEHNGCSGGRVTEVTSRVKEHGRRRQRRSGTVSQSLSSGGLNRIIADVNRTLVGWLEYFKRSHRAAFSGLDGWVRMRLRTILPRRRDIRGRAKGGDNVRYTNFFFAEQGLFSLEIAHALASQSSSR